MKKIFVMVLVLLSINLFTGCGSDGSDSDTDTHSAEDVISQANEALNGGSPSSSSTTSSYVDGMSVDITNLAGRVIISLKNSSDSSKTIMINLGVTDTATVIYAINGTAEWTTSYNFRVEDEHTITFTKTTLPMDVGRTPGPDFLTLQTTHNPITAHNIVNIYDGNYEVTSAIDYGNIGG